MKSPHPTDESPRALPELPPEEETVDSTTTEQTPSTDALTDESMERDQNLFTPADDPASLLHFDPGEEDPTSTVSGYDERQLEFDSLSVGPEEKKDDKGPRIIHKTIIRREKGFFVRSVSAAIVYLVAVLCAGILSGMLIIAVANDVFAFVKDDSLYEITIDNSKMSLHDLSEYLGEEGIIEYPFVFRLYVGLKDDGEITLQEGTYLISPSFNYDKILNSLNPAPVREEITLTFAEGSTIDDMIDLFVANGIGTREGFVDVIQNYDFDYWFLEGLEPSEERFYRLEGYLYPDTYRFFTNSSEATAIKKLLDNFERKVPSSYQSACEALGMTLDEVITVASLIEAECTWVSDFEYVSAVFHNRLKSTEFNGRLDSDATIQYYLRHTTGSRKEELTAEDLAIDSPYNSRVRDGLIPGPICNPSLDALTAAIYPNEECGYYYFVAQANGYNLYAKTYNQHLQNVETVRKAAAGDETAAE